jgi:hypothetical protein
MAPLIITSPTAAAALVLADLLHEPGDAVATGNRGGTWEGATHLHHEALLPGRCGR